LLLCLVYPKAWVGFDWRIEKVDVAKDHIRVFNTDGSELWSSAKLPAALAQGHYHYADSLCQQYWCAGNSDSDRMDELIFAPVYEGDVGAGATVMCFDHNGDTLWTRNTFAVTTYPGDVPTLGFSRQIKYNFGYLLPVTLPKLGQCVLTYCSVSSPARAQLQMYSLKGEKVGEGYLHSGHQTPGTTAKSVDVDGNGSREIVFYGLNNVLGRACVAILDPGHLAGVSPPYDSPLFLESGMSRGSQLAYLGFPKTRLSEACEASNYPLGLQYDSTTRTMRVSVAEGEAAWIWGQQISLRNPSELPTFDYILDSNFIPVDIVPADRQFFLLQDYLRRLGLPTYVSLGELKRYLLENVVVYHDDSIVHWPAEGIDFYDRHNAKHAR